MAFGIVYIYYLKLCLGVQDGVFVVPQTYWPVALFQQNQIDVSCLFARGSFIQICKKGREIEKSGHGQINLLVFVMESEISPAQWRLGKAGS